MHYLCLILNVFYTPRSIIFLYLPNLHTQLQFHIGSPYLDKTLPFDNRPRRERSLPDPTLLTSTTMQTEAYPHTLL